MPSKKKSKSSASSSTSFDNIKFVSGEAENRHYDMVVHKNYIQQSFDDLEHYMRETDCGKELKAIHKATIARTNTVVREFYANAKDH